MTDDLEGSRAAGSAGTAELLTAAGPPAAAGPLAAAVPSAAGGGTADAAAPALSPAPRRRAREAAVLAAFVAAGIVVTWPRAAYVTGRLPRTRDASSYVWSLAAVEAGWSGYPGPPAMPAALTALDAPIAADHTGSIVVDVPFGLRGGIPLYGDAIDEAALVIAIADGHPRAVSYTSWVPAPTTAAISRHAFYVQLIAAQEGGRASAAQTAAAREDLRSLRVGWVLVWEHPGGPLVSYLSATGFGFSYRADGAWVYRPPPPPGSAPGF